MCVEYQTAWHLSSWKTLEPTLEILRGVMMTDYEYWYVSDCDWGPTDLGIDVLEVSPSLAPVQRYSR